MEIPNHRIGGTTIRINMNIMEVLSGCPSKIIGATTSPGNMAMILPRLNNRAAIRQLAELIDFVATGAGLDSIAFPGLNSMMRPF